MAHKEPEDAAAARTVLFAALMFVVHVIAIGTTIIESNNNIKLLYAQKSQ